jgi:hypothetical protein
MYPRFFVLRWPLRLGNGSATSFLGFGLPILAVLPSEGTLVECHRQIANAHDSGQWLAFVLIGIAIPAMWLSISRVGHQLNLPGTYLVQANQESR